MKYIAFLFIVFSMHLASKEQILCRDLGHSYDVLRLQEELKRVEGYYLPRFIKDDNWDAIPLRNASGSEKRDGIEIGKTIKAGKMLPCKNTIFMYQLPYIQSIIDDIADKYDAKIGLVRISKVPSGRHIFRHKDGVFFDIDSGDIYRMHIPIITDPEVVFEIDEKDFFLEAGRLYYTNVSKQHSVTNASHVDRIHLLIDVHANKMLRSHIVKSKEVAAH